MQPIAMSVADALNYIGIGRTKFYELVNEGKISVGKLGRRTVVITASLHLLLEDAVALRDGT